MRSVQTTNTDAAAPVCENPSLCKNETCAPTHIAVPGTGLGPLWLGAILCGSIALFLVWGGPLWLAPFGASHLVRIGASYAVVIPAVYLALRRCGTWSPAHLAGATGAIWAVKLVITSLLYALLSFGGSRYEPARPWEARPPRETTRSAR